MLSIRQNLETKERAEEFNKEISQWRCDAITKGYHPGCVGELACVHCYHVISDSICLCVGVFICPNCGKDNGEKREFKEFAKQPSIFPNFYESSVVEDYSI